MANELTANNSFTAFKVESSEGTPVAPASTTDGWTQIKDDSFEIVGTQELLERTIETSTLSKSTPQLGIKGGTGSMATEIIGSGSEGGAPDYDLLLQSLLGTTDHIAGNNTTRSSGNSQVSLAIEDADIAEYSVGNLVIAKESGEHRVHAITAITGGAGTWGLTVSPGKSSGNFTNSVVISKVSNYTTSDTAASSFTVNRYTGDGTRETLNGARVTSMSIDNWTTGQIGSLTWNLQGMSTTNTASSTAPYTPSFSTALPAVFLGAKLFVGASEILVPEFSLNIDQPVSQLKNTGNSNGVSAQFLAQKRTITGSFPLYTDSSSVSEFTDFNNGTTFSLLAYAAVPSTTAGEVTFGSVFAVYLPVCIRTGVKYGNVDGIVTEEIEFMASGGVNGQNSEITIAYI